MHDESTKTHQDELDLRKDLGRTDSLPEQQTILQAVHPLVLGEGLVEAVDRRKENNRVDVVEVRIPRVPLEISSENGRRHPETTVCHVPAIVRRPRRKSATRARPQNLRKEGDVEPWN